MLWAEQDIKSITQKPTDVAQEEEEEIGEEREDITNVELHTYLRTNGIKTFVFVVKITEKILVRDAD